MAKTHRARHGLSGLAALAALVAAFGVGRAPQWHAAAVKSGAREVLYYIDPMHPSYHSNRPGKAPDCGMELEPVYAYSGATGGAADKPGTVRLTSGQEQVIRLKTETLRHGNGSWEVETIGRVVPEEGLTFRVSAGTDGWVRRVFSDATGTQVKKGQKLAAFYGKDVSPPQQGHLFALESYERLRKSAAKTDQIELAARQVALSHEDLGLIGMGDEQIAVLDRTRRETYEIDLTAPADGQILERNIDVGDRFTKGTVLYQLADLSRVWVLADVWLRDVELVGSVQKARIAIGGVAPMDARVTGAPLDFGRDAAVGKLRLEVDNSRHLLVPGIFVKVTLTVDVGPALTLDENAVLESGRRSHVFVALGDGRYEPREVETGWRQGGRIEIRAGLKEGEAVVTEGGFLLDSESRLRSSAEGKAERAGSAGLEHVTSADRAAPLVDHLGVSEGGQLVKTVGHAGSK